AGHAPAVRLPRVRAHAAGHARAGGGPGVPARREAGPAVQRGHRGDARAVRRALGGGPAGTARHPRRPALVPGRGADRAAHLGVAAVEADLIAALAGGLHAQDLACTPTTARPEGSAAAVNAASHSIAAGEEQAIDLPPGTVRAQASPGKWRSNRLRYHQASFVAGGLTGKRVAASASRASVTCASACALRPSIQP